jgi:hypothetical protein
VREKVIVIKRESTILSWWIFCGSGRKEQKKDE